MMWDSSATAVTIKAIGTVESNLNYGAVNYNDPITIGVAQWFGVRAAALLSRIRSENPSSWTGVSSSLTSDLDNNSPDSTYWNSRYLTQAEGDSLVPVLTANKDIQDAVFGEDIDGYLDTARAWGMNPDVNTQAVSFFCTMYHQAPARSRDVIDAVGTAPSLLGIYRGALANPVLGQYKTRQDTCYSIINAWNPTDGEAPDPGHNEDGGDGGVKGSTVKYVQKQGDLLIVHMDGGGVTTAYPTTANTWVVRANEFGGVEPNPDPDPIDPDNPTPPEPTPGAWHDPLDNLRCTNRFGKLSYTAYHYGIDMGAQQRNVPGDPVYAIHAGTVVRTGGHQQVLVGHSGNQILIDMGIHNGDRMFYFVNHLNTIDCEVGDTVQAGDQIATMGGTGATGSNDEFAVHLHLNIMKNIAVPSSGPIGVGTAKLLNPETYLKSKGILQGMNVCPYN